MQERYEAKIKGEGICGRVTFVPRRGGTLVTADIRGLPDQGSNFYAFHIHEGESCGGVGFAESGGHFNPCGTQHPGHAGDLPPLLGCYGRAWMQVWTGRFKPGDVAGKTVIIHSGVDDFTSQPAGNAGTKIACGKICRIFG